MQSPLTLRQRQPIILPAKLPGETLDWSIGITDQIDIDVDQIAILTAQIAPSGTGELLATELSVTGNFMNITTTGGQPTRTYTFLFAATATDGRVFNFKAQQRIDAVLDSDRAQIVPSSGFGAAITWTSGAVVQGGGLIGVATIAAAGTDQGSATRSVAQTNIVNAGSGGVRALPISSLLYGSQRFINITNTDVLLYPFGSDAFGAAAAGAPVTVTANNGSVEIILVPGAVAWVVA